MKRLTWIVFVCLAACSSEPAENNARPSGQNNSTSGTNNTSGTTGTTGTNNGTPGTNNATNAPTTNVTTTTPEPRRRFAGLCAPPDVTMDGGGCSWDWRCSNPLALVCAADGTCQCVNDSVPANSFAADVDALCSADVAAITATVLAECSWSVSYVAPLSCSTGRSTLRMGGCNWEWDCAGVSHEVDCADDRNAGYDCTCIRGGRPNGLAFPGGRSACSGSEADAIANARAGCGWDISTN